MVEKKDKKSSTSMKDMFWELNSAFEMMSKTAPEYLRNYMKYFVDTGEKGELSEKTKELISIAIAVTSRCLPCIAFHVSSAVEYGATKKEILEASEVAVLMGGSPSFVYLKYVIDACEEFGAE